MIFFSELGINNTVANYMTTMFDAGFQMQLEAELKYRPNSTKLSEIQRYDTFIDQLLRDKKLTIVELFRKMAIQ